MPSLRPDRLLSVGLFSPACHFLNRHHSGCRIPILMYHGVRRERSSRHPYFETNIDPELFAKQMRFLHENSYRTLLLSDAVRRIESRTENQNCVAITFDDGYLDFYTAALPILLQYRFAATMFVVSDLSTTIAGNPVSQFMNWHHLKEICSHGIEIGSHTASHPQLWRLRTEQLEHELLHSKEVIQDRIGKPVRSFSHPYAFPEHDTRYTERLAAVLNRYVYDNGVSTVIGSASPKY